MSSSYEFHSEANAGTEDEFGSTLKKIIDKQTDLEKVTVELKKEKEILTNNLFSVKQQKEEKLKQREVLKLSVVGEQDNFDYINARLINEILTIKGLFTDVEAVTKLSNDFIEKNSIVTSFFDGISRSYKDLEESTNNLALNITQENMIIKEKVSTHKQYKEKLLSDIQNDTNQCEYDLKEITNVVSCLKNVIFEKLIEFSKLSVTEEYVCVEETKGALNLQNFERNLKALVKDGKNIIDEKRSLSCVLEERHETLRNTLSEMKTDAQTVDQFICSAEQEFNDLKTFHLEKENEEKSCNEELLVKNNKVDELVKIQCSLKSDLKVKEDLYEDNEKIMSALEDLEKIYNELTSEKSSIVSDIEYVDSNMNAYLQDIESETHQQSELLADKEKMLSEIEALNVHLNQMKKNYYQNLNSMKEEVENSKKGLVESENSLNEIIKSNVNKAQQLQDNKSKFEDSRNALATLMELLELETKKVDAGEKNIEENHRSYIELLEEINSKLQLKNEELIAAEQNAVRISSLKEKIDQTKSELEKQQEEIRSELMQLESDCTYRMNEAEERFKTLKIQLENKHKKLQTELLEYQTVLTELGNIEHKLGISLAALKEELATMKEKSKRLFGTKSLLQSKFSNARKKLKSAENNTDDVSASQLSVVERHGDNEDDSSSGISISDPKWAIPKRKSGDSVDEERSQKKQRKMGAKK